MKKEYFIQQNSNLVMWLQDKSNKSVVIDKKTDRNKTQEQIEGVCLRR